MAGAGRNPRFSPAGRKIAFWWPRDRVCFTKQAANLMAGLGKGTALRRNETLWGVLGWARRALASLFDR